MAVGMLLAGEGVTREAYVQVAEKMFGNFRCAQIISGGADRPHGRETPEGFYIYDVWESREQFLRFNEEHVGPAMREIVGDAPDAPRPEPQFFDIEVLASPA